MPEERELEKQLKLATKTGKFVVGRKEVLSGLKGTKLLVWSASAGVPQKLLDESKALGIPAVRFTGNPVELGRACGIPFRVSIISVKSTGDADVSAFSGSSDYVSAALPSIQVISQSQATTEEIKEGSPKKQKKTTEAEKGKLEEKAPPEKKVKRTKIHKKKEEESAPEVEQKEHPEPEKPAKKPKKVAKKASESP